MGILAKETRSFLFIFLFFFFLVYIFLRIVSILTMPADLKPLCPAHPTSLKGDSCAGAPDKKGTHDTDCLATRAPELFQQTHAKGYQCKTKRGCEDEFLSEPECPVRLTKRELLCRCEVPDLSAPGACEGPIPLTRDKLVIDPHTGKPNCPSKQIDIGSRIVYPKKGPMTIGYMGHIPGMDVCMSGRNYSLETEVVLRHVRSSERLSPREQCENETYAKAKANARWNTKPDCRPLTDEEKTSLCQFE